MTEYDARVPSHEANYEEGSALVQRLVGIGLPDGSPDPALIADEYRKYLIRKYN